MTSMEQIEFIQREARKLGMRYGDYVAKYGSTLPAPTKAGMADNKRICEKCGAIYTQTGHTKGKYCRACSDGKGEQTEAPRCRWCGEKFQPKHGGEKYCSDECRAAHRQEYMKEYHKKEKWKNEKRTQSGNI